MSTHPVDRGAPQASDFAVETAMPIVGNTSRDDGQTTLNKIEDCLSDLYQDTNIVLTGGGTLTFDGTNLSWTDDLYLQYTRVRGTGAVQPSIYCIIGVNSVAIPNLNVAYVKNIDRTTNAASSVTVTPLATGASSIKAGINNATMFAVRRDSTDGTKVLYLRNGQSITEGQSVRLGASGSGGAGSGEINYILNPSALTNIDDGTPKTGFGGWNLVGSNLALTRDTTAANLPREHLTATGISILGTSGTETSSDYVYYDFTLDDVDLNKCLKIKWDQKIISTYAAGQLAVTITDQSNNLIATPQITSIPANDGTFGTNFMSTSTAALRIKIAATGAIDTGAGIVISDVVAGPGILVQGPAVSDWQTLACTASWTTNTNINSKGRRVGDQLEVVSIIDLSGDPNAGALTISLPAGYTIDTSKIGSTYAYSTLGYGRIKDNSLGALNPATVVYSSTTAVLVMSLGVAGSAKDGELNSVSDTASWPFAFDNNDTISVYFSVPIVGWSSGVFLATSVATSPAKAGFIEAYAGDTPPSGWMLCDGSSLLRTDYLDLFTNIGTSWGNADSTHFNIPDLRGIFLKGAGTTVSNTIIKTDAIGQDASGNYYSGGTVGKTSYKNDKMQGHLHVVNHDHASQDFATTAISDSGLGNHTHGFAHTHQLNGTNGVAGGSNEIDKYSSTGTTGYGWTTVSQSTTTTGTASSFSHGHTTAVNLSPYTGDSGSPKTDGTNGTPFTGHTSEPQSASVTYIIKLYNDNPASVVGFSQAKPNQVGLITSYTPTIKSRKIEINNADYTVLDEDGYDEIISTTTLTANRTVTLPTAADNTGRRITVTKADSSYYGIAVKGEAAGESINGILGTTGVNVFPRYVSMTFLCTGTAWLIIESKLTTDFATPSTNPIMYYGATTATNVSSGTWKVRRVGDSAECVGTVVFNGAANFEGYIEFTAPYGLTIDTNKTVDYSIYGDVYFYTNSKMYRGTVVFQTGTSSTKVYITRSDDSGANVSVWTGSPTAGNNIPSGAAIANNDSIRLRFVLPISEWATQA